MNKPYPCTVYKNEKLREEYRKYKHPSGLDIYIFPKEMTSTYALFGTKYGSIHNQFREPNGDWMTVPDGIAHFLEHKLFTAEDGSDAFERFSEYGADANAYTSFNKTCYLFSCTDRFEESLAELLIHQRWYNPFPKIRYTERPDVAAAQVLEGIPGAALISVGSDGTDGPTDAAGGYADTDTVAQLREKGMDVQAYLDNNDAYHALDAVGNLIFTGPTGTNVNDLTVGLIQ